MAASKYNIQNHFPVASAPVIHQGDISITNQATLKPTYSKDEVLMKGSSFVPISFYVKLVERGHAVCLLSVPNFGLGTGFLVQGSPNPRIMTSKHVFPKKEVTGAKARFHFCDGESMIEVDMLPDNYYWHSPELDFCIVACNSPPADVKPIPLTNVSTISSSGPINIIQHPGGGSKQVALRPFSLIPSEIPNLLRYTTSTLPGSSGSPVFDDDWNLLGIHKSGNAEFNEAVSIRSILEKLPQNWNK